MSIDVRTRWDGETPRADPIAFLDAGLADLADAGPDLVASTSHLDLRPLTIDMDGTTWLLRRVDGSIRVGRCGDALPASSLVLRVTGEQFADLVDDQVTPIGWFTAGILDLSGGGIGRLLDWWLVIRSLLDGRPVHVPGAIGLPPDLGRSFTLDDDPAGMLAFLESAGYLHLRGVFTPGEMAMVSDDMDVAAPRYRPDDANSWWATLADGTRTVVRMQRFEEQSAATAALLTDERFLRIGALPGCGHTTQWSDDNRVEALFKPIGVTEGISDVPWHKDCSLGRHSYECCALTVGISVTGAGPTSGQLRVVAGSHRALVWPSLLDTGTLDLPEVALATATGDVTVHLSCTLHMAQPPTERERRVLYTGFGLTPRHPGAHAAATHRLAVASREAAPLTTSQPPAGSAPI